MKTVMKHRRYYWIIPAVVMFLIFIYGCPPKQQLATEAPPAVEAPHGAEDQPAAEAGSVEEPTGGPPPFPFIISGYIKDPSIESGTLFSIEDANVVAKLGVGSYPPGGVLTDSSGFYAIVVTLEGNYEVEVTHPSYNTATSSVAVEFSPGGPTEFSRDFNSMTHNCSGHPVRVLRGLSVNYVPNLTSAFSTAVDGDRIQSQIGPLTEGDLTYDRPRSISLIGGFNSCFSPVSDFTILRTNMTLTHGSSTVSNFEIGP